MSIKAEISTGILKLSPPVAVIWASVAGWGPQEWMYALTSVYVVLQIVHLGWRWFREARRSGCHES
jgi:hypothetical protein